MAVRVLLAVALFLLVVWSLTEARTSRRDLCHAQPSAKACVRW